jgi:preprotein translocase subunit SecY
LFEHAIHGYMKRILFLSGIVLCLLAVAGIFKILATSHSLSRFEWGYLSGKLLLLLLGCILLFIARKKKPIQ